MISRNLSIGDECTNGDVRMVNGSTVDEGRVEYCYEKTWSPVCSLSSRAATLMCQKMGYTSFTCQLLVCFRYVCFSFSYFLTGGSVINDERFGRTNNKTLFNYMYCSSSAAQLSDCTEYTKGGGCYLSVSSCGTEYGLRCYSE